MLSMETFARTDVAPSWWANALGKALSQMPFGGLRIVQTDATHLAILASADAGAVVASVGGLWRWIEATLTTAHPGGAAGQYDIFLTAANNNITNAPLPNSDHTNYAFGLAIVQAGHTPNIVAGVVDVFSRAGWCFWDGAKIIYLEQGLMDSRFGAPAMGHRAAALALPGTNAWQQIPIDTVEYDPQAHFASGTYLAIKPGVHEFRGQVSVGAASSPTVCQAALVYLPSGGGSAVARVGAPAVSPAAVDLATSVVTGRLYLQQGDNVALAIRSNQVALALGSPGALGIPASAANYLEGQRVG